MHTEASEVNLKMLKLRTLLFGTAIIERYRRCDSSVKKSLTETYLVGMVFKRS
ncbi:MAG TPA: hypothetical protein ENH32_07785 [Proteobacteria bacterium]|nr:hypothetical protein [Pseudomonadota bacterium]